MKKILALVALFALTASAQQSMSGRNLLRNRSLSRAAQPAQNQSVADSAQSQGDGEEAPAFNWDAAPVDIVLQAYGDRVGKTILKDPGVPSATITLKSRQGQKLTNEEYLEAIETVLEMNQVHLEPYGESFIRALPRKTVRKDGIPLIMDPTTRLNDSGRVVSMWIPFKNISTEEAQKALEGFKSDSGILLVFERTNSILATDTEQNINRMLEIAKVIDIASPVTEVVEYIQIKYANANDIKQIIDSIVQESMKEQEKNGNAPVSNQAQSRPTLGRSLLGRNNRNENQAPVNNESLVMTVSDADRGMIRGKVVTIADERSNKLLLITSQVNMRFFKEVIAALDVETTPDTVVKVYRLKYAEAEDVSDMINDLIGNSSSSKNSGKANQNQAAKTGTSGSVTRGNQTAAKKPANQRAGEAKAGELNKDNTTVLADKRINGIVVMTDKDLVPTIEQIIDSMDIKLSQVLIETTIIEVMLGDGIETGMDWVQKGRQSVRKPITAGYSVGEDGSLSPQNLFHKSRTVTTEYADGNTRTSTSILPDLVPADYSSESTTTYDDRTVTISDAASSLVGTMSSVARDGIMNLYGGATSVGLAGGAANGADALSVANGAFAAAPSLKKAFNFVFDSDELGLSAILQASKNDSRSKYVASPIVMTLDNKEAVVNATQMRYILKGFTSSGNSYSTIAVPDYEQKELGIEIKVTPKINPNGTVMLTVEEKYTQLGDSQTIQYAASNTGGSTSSDEKQGVGSLQDVQVPTTITREMSADVLLENNQTVVFGGLTEKSISESESGIPFLKDIPFIGKWLFGSVKQNETRTELLVFMTPYVLNDAQAAQAEAIRRKKTMSDSNPWDDDGWSLSPLADPVSKREQMRRIKDEWVRQDEERRTKIAIEQMKVDRAKKLQALSKEERDLWLKMHKDELEEEQREELEEKMLDKDSQEELKKLAAQIREEKLDAADKEIKKAADEVASENERGKLDAEKAKQTKAAEKAESETKDAANK